MEAVTAALHALEMIADPQRLLMLAAGVLIGLSVGIIPGIGGTAAIALLLPFTFGMDPYMAFAFLLGIGATISTGDPIPAVLFGVPGGAGSAATVLDGLPMAKRGEGGRALSAAYMSSLLGGLFGAVLMAIAIPTVKPLILYLGSPEMLAFSIFGISMVAMLSGSAPLKGLAAAGIGVLISLIGADPQTGQQRWTFSAIYLWEGLPLVPVVLGLFALPELCDLAISRTAISGERKYDTRAGMLQGAKDCFKNWWLVLRCSWIGSAFGAIPGIGSAVIDWLAYGHAMRTEKGAAETFGKGDVRGVIASESANNAREGGALVPTIAFGVPGSAGMAVLLGAFLIHGLAPGPDMLGKNLSVTYSMVWSIALANILGAGLCYAFSGQFAKLATLRYTLILPAVLSVIFIGAFEGSRNWGDLYVLLAFGALGWTMKQLKWPRPPLILGFVLGGLIERYLVISTSRYGWDWLQRPLVIALLAFAAFGLLRAFLKDAKARGGFSALGASIGAPRFQPSQILHLVLLALVGLMVVQSLAWAPGARTGPLFVGVLTLGFLALSLAVQAFLRPAQPAGGAQTLHMDSSAAHETLTPRIVARRGLTFFGWLAGFMVSMALIGLIPSVFLLVVLYMRLENRERWRLVLPYAVVMTTLVYAVFDRMLSIPWPDTVLGRLVPALTALPSV